MSSKCDTPGMEETVKAVSLSGWSLKGRKKMGYYSFSSGSSLAALPRPVYLLLVLLALSRRAAGSDVIRIGECIIFSVTASTSSPLRSTCKHRGNKVGKTKGRARYSAYAGVSL